MTAQDIQFISEFQEKLITPLQYAIVDNPGLSRADFYSLTLSDTISSLRMVSSGKKGAFTLEYTVANDLVSAQYTGHTPVAHMEHTLWELYTYLGTDRYTRYIPHKELVSNLREGLMSLLKIIRPHIYN